MIIAMAVVTKKGEPFQARPRARSGRYFPREQGLAGSQLPHLVPWETLNFQNPADVQPWFFPGPGLAGSQ